jgi:putative ABC transport system permease protein
VIVIARLREGDRRAALDQARAVAAAVPAPAGRQPDIPDLVPLRTAVSGARAGPLLILFGAVAAVFLISVTSLATLILARAAGRAGDIALRTSLGASRWRLIRSWLLDGAVLALPGLLLGTWLGELLLEYGHSTLAARALPLPQHHAVAPMIIAAIGLSAATSVLFAIAPVTAGLLRAPSAGLRDLTRSVAGLRRVRSQSVLIAGQVALSLMLVTSAVWLSTSLYRMLSRPVGFDAANLVTIHTESAQTRSVQLDGSRLVLSRLRQLAPDLSTSVAVTSSLPGLGADLFGPIRIHPGQPAFSDDERPRWRGPRSRQTTFE